MFPLDLLESRLGNLSDRAFEAVAAKEGTEAIAEESVEQSLLRRVDQQPAHLDEAAVASAVDSGLVRRTHAGWELTPLGKYKLRG